MVTGSRSMNRKRAVLGAGGIAAVVIAGTSMIAWSNGAFGTPAVDRVGSFRAIEAQLAPAPKPAATVTTNTEPPESSAPRSTLATTGPSTTESSVVPTDGEKTGSTEPIGVWTSTSGVGPAEQQSGSKPEVTSVAPASSTTVSQVTSSTTPRTKPDAEVEPPSGRGNDD